MTLRLAALAAAVILAGCDTYVSQRSTAPTPMERFVEAQQDLEARCNSLRNSGTKGLSLTL